MLTLQVDVLKREVAALQQRVKAEGIPFEYLKEVNPLTLMNARKSKRIIGKRHVFHTVIQCACIHMFKTCHLPTAKRCHVKARLMILRVGYVGSPLIPYHHCLALHAHVLTCALVSHDHMHMSAHTLTCSYAHAFPYSLLSNLS